MDIEGTKNFILQLEAETDPRLVAIADMLAKGNEQLAEWDRRIKEKLDRLRGDGDQPPAA